VPHHVAIQPAPGRTIVSSLAELSVPKLRRLVHR
jgi:hypothetical protein